MITAGVDLAAQPERTAVATIEWSAGRAVIKNAACNADDQAVLGVVQRAGKTGIDCPLGWPADFVSFVTAHHAHQVPVPGGQPGSRRSLTMRRTDLFVRERLGLTPLSVSADRIAHVALRCAVLLAKLEAEAGPVDRAGTGPVAEVYSAASLRSWGLPHHGYKQKTAKGVLGGLVDRLREQAPWLDCATHEQAMRDSHDIFDAVIAAMTARAAALGQVLHLRTTGGQRSTAGKPPADRLPASTRPAKKPSSSGSPMHAYAGRQPGPPGAGRRSARRSAACRPGAVFVLASDIHAVRTHQESGPNSELPGNHWAPRVLPPR